MEAARIGRPQVVGRADAPSVTMLPRPDMANDMLTPLAWDCGSVAGATPISPQMQTVFMAVPSITR